MAGQAGGAMDVWDFCDLNDLQTNTDGTVTLLQGDTKAATTDDDVLVLNGTVVLQENQIVPGSAFAEPIDGSGIVKGWLDNAGNWYARGNNDGTEQDWVVRNGVVVAFSDGLDEIVTGSGEHWDDTDFFDCFFAFDGNASGAYVIAGVTDAVSTSNGVIVHDDGAGNRTVICREGDPVDADGNGMFDDDRFFNTFGNDDILLDDNGSIWFTATIRDGAGTTQDQGFFRLDVGGDPFPSHCNGDGGNQMGCTDCPCANNSPIGTIGGCLNSALTSTRLIASGDPSASLPAGSVTDLQFEVEGSPPTATNVLLSGDNVAPTGMMNPCFGLNSGIQASDRDGLRCAVGGLLRHGNRQANAMGEIKDAMGPSRVWGGPTTPNAGIAGQAGFVAGQTRYFQVTHRDVDGAVCPPGTGLNTSQAVEVTFTP